MRLSFYIHYKKSLRIEIYLGIIYKVPFTIIKRTSTMFLYPMRNTMKMICMTTLYNNEVNNHKYIQLKKEIKINHLTCPHATLHSSCKYGFASHVVKQGTINSLVHIAH